MTLVAGQVRAPVETFDLPKAERGVQELDRRVDVANPELHVSESAHHGCTRIR
jgi:hypothetical protein